MFRKRQNWFVQFSPLYDRGLAGREWTQKEEREREREVHPAHREGKHCDGHFFELVQSTGRHCPRHHRYFSSAFSRSATIRRYRSRYRNGGIARSRSLPESNGTSRRDWGGRGRMDGKGWKEFEAPFEGGRYVTFHPLLPTRSPSVIQIRLIPVIFQSFIRAGRCRGGEAPAGEVWPHTLLCGRRRRLRQLESWNNRTRDARRGRERGRGRESRERAIANSRCAYTGAKHRGGTREEKKRGDLERDCLDRRPTTKKSKLDATFRPERRGEESRGVEKREKEEKNGILTRGRRRRR